MNDIASFCYTPLANGLRRMGQRLVVTGRCPTASLQPTSEDREGGAHFSSPCNMLLLQAAEYCRAFLFCSSFRPTFARRQCAPVCLSCEIRSLCRKNRCYLSSCSPCRVTSFSQTGKKCAKNIILNISCLINFSEKECSFCCVVRFFLLTLHSEPQNINLWQSQRQEICWWT